MAVVTITPFTKAQASRRWDPEFHTHPARHIEERLSRAPFETPSLRRAARRITSGHTPRRHDLTQGDVAFLTVECVSPLTIHKELAKRVTRDQYEKELQRVALDDTCVLVTIKRRIGQACPCYGLEGPTAVNQDVAVVRTHPRWLSGYVAAYLCSMTGQQIMDRLRTEQMNPYIPVGTLSHLPIPELSHGAQRDIDRIVRSKLAADETAARLYSEAESVLADALRLEKLDLSHKLGYETCLADVGSAHRWDAQCFDPCYTAYGEAVARIRNAAPLRGLCTPPVKGQQQDEAEEGSIPYVSIKHLSEFEVIPKCFGSRDKAGSKIASRNDLLLAITGATIGKVGVVERNEEIAFSGDLLRLRPRPGLDALYLLVFLRSPAGQSQILRWVTGSTNGHLAPRDVMRIVVPRLGKKEAAISAKIREALTARRDSEALLEKAKRRVEELIGKEAAV